jgi:broad specificity phosphatase PhoE
MQTMIYLTRHGEVYNPNQICYGRLLGYPLSKKGKKEIAATAQFLFNKKIAAVYSSPLLRAKQSAQIIATKTQAPLFISRRLIEVKTSLQGKPLSLTNKINDDFYFSSYRKSTDETMEQIAKRMLQFIFFINKKYYGKSIVALSHGDPIMLSKAWIEKRPFKLNSIRDTREISYIRHGEVYKIVIDEKNKLSLTSVFKPAL